MNVSFAHISEENIIYHYTGQGWSIQCYIPFLYYYNSVVHTKVLYILILNSFESYKGFIVNFYRFLHRIESNMALHHFYVFMYSLYFRCPFLDLPGYFGNGRFGWIRQAGSSYNSLFWTQKNPILCERDPTGGIKRAK